MSSTIISNRDNNNNNNNVNNNNNNNNNEINNVNNNNEINNYNNNNNQLTINETLKIMTTTNLSNNNNKMENSINDENFHNNNGKYMKYPELETMLPENFDDLYKTMPITKETSCGIWIFKGAFLQKFANKKVYVLFYGIIGCVFSAAYAYFNGTITTLEKRYKIPSRNTGIISVGNDISQIFISAILSYYAGKGHRPRWMAFGLITICIFCFMNALPHLLYGSGEDAISLTLEYGAVNDTNSTNTMIDIQRRKDLCPKNVTNGAQCEIHDGSFAPQFILFSAQFISGIGQPLFYTLGISYMDDNMKKSKTPAYVSMSYFLRMLGPALGYTLASFCLKIYISPYLTPTINNLDPRWLGAWWLGWVLLGGCMLLGAFLTAMFPRTLPRAAVRRAIHNERVRRELSVSQPEPEVASIKDMIKTFKRLCSNATLTCNNISSVFYFFGYLPYWTFTPKYIETQYRQSASVSSLVTGAIALAFSALGILLSGLVITKFKPSARHMAAWNVLVGAVSVMGILSYTMLGCTDNEKSIIINNQLINDNGVGGGGSVGNSIANITDIMPNLLNSECTNCHCEYVKYSPVCGQDGNTYISACHAGCTEFEMVNGKRLFTECACIKSLNDSSSVFENLAYAIYATDNITTEIPIQRSYYDSLLGGIALPGSCPVNCYKQFVTFLTVMCFLKFIGSTGRATNFLVSVRCVAEKDKTVAMGLSLTLMSLFAFIPSPIFFGSLLDKTCLVWGKTCSAKGNCWLYDTKSLRWSMNTIAAGFVTIGVLFDMGVWYFVKNLKIFDDEIEEKELDELNKLNKAKENSENIKFNNNNNIENNINIIDKKVADENNK